MGLFRRIKKIIGLKEPTKNEKLEKDGLLKVGSNSDISHLSIDIRTSGHNRVFIEIGKDCSLTGHFVIENQEGNINVGNNTFIGGGIFASCKQINIGSNVLMSWGISIIDYDGHSLDHNERIKDLQDWKKGSSEGFPGKYKNWNSFKKGEIIIKDNVWIGFNCIILKGITIGEGAVIGAGSVVTKDVEPYSIVAGNPAKFVKKIKQLS